MMDCWKLDGTTTRYHLTNEKYGLMRRKLFRTYASIFRIMDVTSWFVVISIWFVEMASLS